MIGGVLDFGGSFLPPAETAGRAVPEGMRLHCRTGTQGTCMHFVLSMLTGRPSDEFLPYSRNPWTNRVSTGMSMTAAVQALIHRGYQVEHLFLSRMHVWGPTVGNGGFEVRPVLPRVMPWLRSRYPGVRYYVVSIRSDRGFHALLLDLVDEVMYDNSNPGGVGCHEYRRKFVIELAAVSRSCA